MNLFFDRDWKRPVFGAGLRTNYVSKIKSEQCKFTVRFITIPKAELLLGSKLHLTTWEDVPYKSKPFKFYEADCCHVKRLVVDEDNISLYLNEVQKKDFLFHEDDYENFAKKAGYESSVQLFSYLSKSQIKRAEKRGEYPHIISWHKLYLL